MQATVEQITELAVEGQGLFLDDLHIDQLETLDLDASTKVLGGVLQLNRHLNLIGHAESFRTHVVSAVFRHEVGQADAGQP